MRRSKYNSVILFLLLSLSASFLATTMASTTDKSPSSSETAVHIVYTEKPDNEEPEAYHIRTLASVLGSEEAAKEALLYSYKTAASGFSAKLTPDQVEEIGKKPGVIQVVPSQKLQLHSGAMKPQNL